MENLFNDMIQTITSSRVIDDLVKSLTDCSDQDNHSPMAHHARLRKHAQMIHIYNLSNDDDKQIISNVMESRLRSAIVSALNAGVTEIALRNI